MVRRFVEQQQVVRFGDRAGQCEAAPLPGGEVADGPVQVRGAEQAEGEQRPGAVRDGQPGRSRRGTSDGPKPATGRPDAADSTEGRTAGAQRTATAHATDGQDAAGSR
ncbi:hypothetical protein GCM10010279_05990 [Streptomyces mutabilis]|nr:hypothetical protein GCM10010279_05990 [Streptomyces mutabilis]